jgi:peptidyl-prolyl cis-trans isomerase C
MVQRIFWRALICAIIVGPAQAAVGAESDPGATPIARNSTVTITRNEFQGEILRIPAEMRGEFVASPKRVGDLLLQMLLRKTLASQARTEKLDQPPINAARIANEVDRVLAQIRIAALEDAASDAFEAKRASYVARAREIYATDQNRYRAPEEISASHILFDLKKHSADDAQRLAQEARAKIASGADFSTLAKQISEDPSAEQNSGRLGWFTRERMDPAFSKAAFALKAVGDVSEPVQSAFGWHIIRLDDRRAARVRPFDDVRDTIIAGLKKKYVDEQRETVLGAIRNDPTTAIEDAEVKAMLESIAAEPVHSHSAPISSGQTGVGKK